MYDRTKSKLTAKTDAAIEKGLDVFEECPEKYGDSRQLLMAVEECGELVQAITKLGRVKDNGGSRLKALDHLAEEMADVRIMLAQLAFMFGNDDAVAAYVDYKLERQRSRISAR